MLMDNLSRFSGSGSGSSVIPQPIGTAPGGPGTTTFSTNFYDLLAGAAVPFVTPTTGAGTYTTPNTIIGNAPVFGMDFGIGSISAQPRCVVEAIQAFTVGTSLQIAFMGQADPGTGSLVAANWTIYEQSDALVPTLLTANTRIASFDWPIRKSLIAGQAAAALPRFVALKYIIVGTFTNGTISADNTIGGADDALGTLSQYAANFVVAA